MTSLHMTKALSGDTVGGCDGWTTMFRYDRGRHMGHPLMAIVQSRQAP